MNKERWKDVKGFEGMYQISDRGRVKSLDRHVRGRYNKKQFKKGKVIKPNIKPDGYYEYVLHKNKKSQHFYAHRLVAQAFIPNPNNYPCVNHIDEIKNHNEVLNLEWCTAMQNNHYRDRIKRIKDSNIRSNGVRVCVLDTEIDKMFHFKTIHECAKFLNCNIGIISEKINSDRNSLYKKRYKIRKEIYYG